jgi:hypothetical protein
LRAEKVSERVIHYMQASCSEHVKRGAMAVGYAYDIVFFGPGPVWPDYPHDLTVIRQCQ